MIGQTISHCRIVEKARRRRRAGCHQIQHFFRVAGLDSDKDDIKRYYGFIDKKNSRLAARSGARGQVPSAEADSVIRCPAYPALPCRAFTWRHFVAWFLQRDHWSPLGFIEPVAWFYFTETTTSVEI